MLKKKKWRNSYTRGKKKKKKHPENERQMRYETKHMLDLIDSMKNKNEGWK